MDIIDDEAKRERIRQAITVLDKLEKMTDAEFVCALEEDFSADAGAALFDLISLEKFTEDDLINFDKIKAYYERMDRICAGNISVAQN